MHPWQRTLAFLIVSIFCGFTLAQSPTTQQARRPTTRPDSPRDLFAEVLTNLHEAPNLSLDINIARITTSASPIENPRNESLLNTTDDHIVHLAIARPNRLLWTDDVARVLNTNASSLCQTVIYDGSRVVSINRSAGRPDPPRGTTSAFEGRLGEDVLNVPETLIPSRYKELLYLVDRRLGATLLQHSQGWNWLSSAMDNTADVWRLEFNDPDNAHWEVWVTQTEPHQITRMNVERNSTTGISVLKPGVTVLRGPISSENSIMTSYQTRKRQDWVFTKWDLATPVDPVSFEAPKGLPLREGHFGRDDSKIKSGDIVRLGKLKNLDGREVDPYAKNGVAVLEFWFASCGPCLVAMPKVEQLVSRFPSATLYNVNPIDSTEEIQRLLTSKQWSGDHVLLDSDRTYQYAFDIIAYPTVVVVDRDGKVLYIDHPSSGSALAQLEDLLKQNEQTAEPSGQPPQ
jgi:thiol-disulfide isomerase/thioredoxin